MTTVAIASPKTTNPPAGIRKHISTLRTRLAQPHRARKVARINEGRLTVAMFLAYLGMTPAQIAATEVKFGKAAVQAHLAATGTKPAQTGAALVRGKLFRVNAYTWDQLGLLVQVAINTPATSALIGI
jgi:hypothetical protein